MNAIANQSGGTLTVVQDTHDTMPTTVPQFRINDTVDPAFQRKVRRYNKLVKEAFNFLLGAPTRAHADLQYELSVATTTLNGATDARMGRIRGQINASLFSLPVVRAQQAHDIQGWEFEY